MIMQFINTRIIKLLSGRIHSSHIDSVVGVVVVAGGGVGGSSRAIYTRRSSAQTTDRQTQHPLRLVDGSGWAGGSGRATKIRYKSGNDDNFITRSCITFPCRPGRQ